MVIHGDPWCLVSLPNTVNSLPNLRILILGTPLKRLSHRQILQLMKSSITRLFERCVLPEFLFPRSNHEIGRGNGVDDRIECTVERQNEHGHPGKDL